MKITAIIISIIEGNERLRGEGDKILKFIDLRFERDQAVGFGKARR